MTDMTTNKSILQWIEENVALCQPDKVVWIDGSDEQRDALRAEACSTGEMIKLNEEKCPGCYLHRTAVNDVARVESRTFICTRKKEDAGNINNWIDPAECYERLTKLYRGSMKGKTMYIIPYSMGIVGSEFAKYGLEITDSIYVVLNMLIMTRVGFHTGELMVVPVVNGTMFAREKKEHERLTEELLRGLAWAVDAYNKHAFREHPDSDALEEMGDGGL